MQQQPGSVRVRIFTDAVVLGDPGNDRLLRRAVAETSGCALESVVLERHCRYCGAEHGKPLVLSPMPDAPSPTPGVREGEVVADRWQASVARCPGRVVVAIAAGVPVGVDVESIERMRRAPVDDVAFHPHELKQLGRLKGASAERARAQLWTRKEAVLKATGEGLRVDLARIRFAGVGEENPRRGVRIVSWPQDSTHPGSVRLRDLDFGGGLVGAIAALTDRALAIEFADPENQRPS